MTSIGGREERNCGSEIASTWPQFPRCSRRETHLDFLLDPDLLLGEPARPTRRRADQSTRFHARPLNAATHSFSSSTSSPASSSPFELVAEAFARRPGARGVAGGGKFIASRRAVGSGRYNAQLARRGD